MITFSNLGRKGRLGNQFFQIASTIGIAKRNGHTFFFPEWEYADFFDYDFPQGDIDSSFTRLREKQFPFYEWELGDENYDLDGWLQSEKYFDVEETKRVFKFEPNFKNEVLQKESELFAKKTVLITVRRGDFVHNNLFFQVPYKYYLLALDKFFPDWRERNLIFASDEIGFCKVHFGHLENAFFLEDRTPMEQLVIGTHCDDFIISNSTFSWWVAWLGEERESKVVRPFKNFRGKSSQPDDKDFFPDRWIEFDHRVKFLPMDHLPLMLRANYIQVKSYCKYLLRIKYRQSMEKMRNLLRVTR